MEYSERDVDARNVMDSILA